MLRLLKLLLMLEPRQVVTSKNKQRTAAFNITGDFNLLGLDASFAAGVERREERSDDVPDPLQLAGLHGGNKYLKQ